MCPKALRNCARSSSRIFPSRRRIKSVGLNATTINYSEGLFVGDQSIANLDDCRNVVDFVRDDDTGCAFNFAVIFSQKPSVSPAAITSISAAFACKSATCRTREKGPQAVAAGLTSVSVTGSSKRKAGG